MMRELMACRSRHKRSYHHARLRVAESLFLPPRADRKWQDAFTAAALGAHSMLGAIIVNGIS
jgi:hypothetical protein